MGNENLENAKKIASIMGDASGLLAYYLETYGFSFIATDERAAGERGRTVLTLTCER